MKSFEPVYKELEYLLIQKLPDYIEKINKEHNDGIILKPFGNTTLAENSIKLPSFTFNIEETEYSEKDRIVENTIFTISLEIKTQLNTQKNKIILYRYFEAIETLIKDTVTRLDCRITNIKGNKIIVRITE